MDLTLTVGGVAAIAIAGALFRWREQVVGVTRRIATYIRDVRGELKKVTWPTWTDLRKTTVVIIIVVAIIGVVIGLMDRFFSLLLIDFLGRVLT